MTRFYGNAIRFFAMLSCFLIAAFTGVLHSVPAAAAGAGQGGGSDGQRQGCYYNLPQITTNLRPVDGFTHFMSLDISICLPSDEAARYLARIEPRVIDSVQPYLRDIRVEDLHGAAGMYQLRRNLLARIRAAARPVTVEEVVFREILVD
jgi:flagellar FliL protein